MLTRLPSGLALPAAIAADLLARRFPEDALRLPHPGRDRLLETLAAAGIAGGATYDGLVALEAAAHEQTLLTLDQRAQSVYQRLGVPFRPIAAGG